MKVHFTREQIEFLMDAFECSDPQESMQKFMDLLGLEGVDPAKAPSYLVRLMARLEGR